MRAFKVMPNSTVKRVVPKATPSLTLGDGARGRSI